ncbi:MAG TPA: hypothetical protein VF444_03465 [Pseudonocardiaceae bacterium]
MSDADVPVIRLSRARDAAEPNDHVRPPRCLVCRTVGRTPGDLTPVHLGVLDLNRAGLPAEVPTTVCRTCLDSALRNLAAPSVTRHNTCSVCAPADPGHFRVVAVWPLVGTIPAGAATIRACRTHLAQALATQASHTNSTTIEQETHT